MQKVVLCCPAMAELAQSIVTGRRELRLGKIRWDKFPDGWPNTFVEHVQLLRGCDVTFLASFANPADIAEQLGVIYALPRYQVGSLRVVLPYFPTATMERVDREGQIATAKTLARLLSNVPLCSPGGPAQVVVYDIHALAERFFFGDQVIPRLETAMPLLRAELDQLDNVAVAFPDEGAWKRFHDQLDGYPHIICHKVRSGDRRTVTIKEGSAKGRHAVIVDDLVQTGETLKQCRRALERAKATDVSAYVTHAVFPNRSWRQFGRGNTFANFWITDSCPGTVESIGTAEPFRVLSLESSIANIIQEDRS